MFWVTVLLNIFYIASCENTKRRCFSASLSIVFLFYVDASVGITLPIVSNTFTLPEYDRQVFWIAAAYLLRCFEWEQNYSHYNKACLILPWLIDTFFERNEALATLLQLSFGRNNYAFCLPVYVLRCNKFHENHPCCSAIICSCTHNLVYKNANGLKVLPTGK